MAELLFIGIGAACSETRDDACSVISSESDIAWIYSISSSFKF